MVFHHKNIRLPRESYVGKQWLFVTLCCAGRHKYFVRNSFCSWFLRLLAANAAAHSVSVHAYCFMPDHVHLLLEGLQPTSDMLELLKAVKRKSSAAFLRKTGQPLWQKKFYDHILRRNDSPDAVAWYIWMNPVRAGICQQPQDYPFLGSLTGLSTNARALFDVWLPPWRNTYAPPKVRRRYMCPG